MTTTPTPPERPQRRKAWVWLAAVGMVLCASFFAARISRARQRAGRVEIDRRLAAIRANDDPVTIGDLTHRNPAALSGRDAAELLAPVLAQMVMPESSKNIPWLGGPDRLMPTQSLDLKLFAQARDLLAANQPALDVVLGLNLNGTWVSLKRTNDFSMGKDEVRKVLTLGRLLLLKSVLAAEEGDPKAAAEYLGQGLAVGQTLPSVTLVHHFCRRIVESHACEVLERMLNRHAVSESVLASVEASFAEEVPSDIREALLEARCFSIWVLEQLRVDPVGSVAVRDMDDPEWLFRLKAEVFGRLIDWSDHGYRDRDFVRILDLWNEVFEALKRPPKLRSQLLKQVQADIEAETRHRSVSWMAAGQLPVGSVERDTMTVARLRTARVALTILRWRVAHEGKLPESLAELVPNTLPAIPEDPFDAQPLRYRRLPQGFTVYSVGPDFTDNGGLRQPAGTEKADGYDVVFEVVRFHDGGP